MDFALFLGMTAARFLGLFILAYASSICFGSDQKELPVDIVNICTARVDFFKEISEKQVSASDVLTSAVKSGAKVILWGESHFEDSFQFYPWTLEKLKSLNNELDCLFIESNGKLNQPSLDKCNRDPQEAYNTSFLNSKSDEYLFTCGEEKPRSFVRDESVREAYKLGMKVYAIDTDQGSNDRDTRNQFMANNMRQLLQTSCRFAVSVNGMNHISKPPSGKGFSFPAYMDGLAISKFKILLASPRAYSFQPSDLWLWKVKDKPICSVNPDFWVNTTFGVPLSQIKNDSPLYWRDKSDNGGAGELSGKWKDFDAAIVLGKPR